MSALDERELIKNGCPDCGGDILRWYYDSDCRGNDSSAGYHCKGKCGRCFTVQNYRDARAAKRDGKVR